MTTKSRLLLLWIATAAEIAAFGALIARFMCPTRLALETLRGSSRLGVSGSS